MAMYFRNGAQDHGGLRFLIVILAFFCEACEKFANFAVTGLACKK